MSLNRTRNIIIGIVLLMMILGLCVYVKYTLEKVRKVLFVTQTEYENCRFTLLENQEAQSYAIKSEFYPISNEVLKLLKEKMCILRIHDGACLGCYAENLLRFTKEMRRRGLNLLVLGTYSTNRQFQSELSDIIVLDSLNSVNVKELYCSPVDSLGCPYLFINDSGRIRNVYVFEKGEYNSIIQYVDFLMRINTNDD